jgi:hypothetical protein
LGAVEIATLRDDLSFLLFVCPILNDVDVIKTLRLQVGNKSMSAGRAGEFAAVGLTETLNRMGFETGRLKTGTPARVDKRSIDYSQLEPQPGDEAVRWFSFDPEVRVEREQIPCYPIAPQPNPSWLKAALAGTAASSFFPQALP